MKLQTFIERNLDLIVEGWEAFASTLLPAAAARTGTPPRGHGREILLAIMEEMQRRRTQNQPATGPPERGPPAPVSQAAAAAYGTLRQAAGFDLAQVMAEFGALRSQVLLLWRQSADSGEAARANAQAAAAVIEQVTDFNRAVDQALGECVQSYVGNVGASKDMLLAVLAHDLRNPLHGIAMAGTVLASEALPEVARVQTAMRLVRATKIMDGLVTDFLEFTRSRLGVGLPIDRADCDLGQACEESLEVVKAGDPAREFIGQLSGNLCLYADYSRLRQVLLNLLNNAVQHGEQGTPVVLSACGEPDAVVLAVVNSGKPIPPEAARMIFEPLVQVPITTSDVNRRPKTSLGLGLFIAREIVQRHHGTISVQSSADGKTVFTIRLPRDRDSVGPGRDLA